MYGERVNDDNPQAWYIGVDKSEGWGAIIPQYPEVNHRLPNDKTKKAMSEADSTQLLKQFLKFLNDNGYEIRKKKT